MCGIAGIIDRSSNHDWSIGLDLLNLIELWEGEELYDWEVGLYGERVAPHNVVKFEDSLARYRVIFQRKDKGCFRISDLTTKNDSEASDRYLRYQQLQSKTLKAASTIFSIASTVLILSQSQPQTKLVWCVTSLLPNLGLSLVKVFQSLNGCVSISQKFLRHIEVQVKMSARVS